MTLRKPGLWHGPRRVEVEHVTDRHKKTCADCGKLPLTRRLMVVDGIARGAKTTVRCAACGFLWIQERRQEAARALHYLRTGDGSIRNST